MKKHITLISRRLWLNVNAGVGMPNLDLQHRIAWPPAKHQTCHHIVMFGKRRLHFRKEVI